MDYVRTPYAEISGMPVRFRIPRPIVDYVGVAVKIAMCVIHVKYWTVRGVSFLFKIYKVYMYTWTYIFLAKQGSGHASKCRSFLTRKADYMLALNLLYIFEDPR